MTILRSLLLASALLPTAYSTAASASEWTLLWSDQFNGRANSAPDQMKWKYDIGRGSEGWGNHELQEYTNSTQNVFLDGKGHLVIRALQTKPGAFTSGRLKTIGLFEVQYGKIEARIKLPYGQGIWPAFWMLGSDIATNPWPKCGEIDIMENIGREPSTVYATLHGPGYSGGHGISSQTNLPRAERFASGFHVFGVEWSADGLEFFVDGKSYSKATRTSLSAGAPWVYDHPFFLLLNVAVGGDWPQNPDPSTKFPQVMLVDWVRVWKPAVTQRKAPDSRKKPQMP